MKRGHLYWVNLEPNHPPEFGKVRPALVISNTEHNLRLPTVVVIPFSSQKPEIWPLRLEYVFPNQKKSYAVIPGIRQVSKARLYERVTVVLPTFLERIDEAIQSYLRDF